MSRLIRFWATYVALLILNPANANDRFDYSVTYRGVFSMGTDMAIADVALSVGPVEPGGPLVETRLEVSSARYPTVEALYPFRYRFRSWSRPDLAPGVVAFDAYKKTSGEKHRAYLVPEAVSEPPRRLRPGRPEDQALLARIQSGEPPVDLQPGSLFDRLGLLQHVRRLPLAEDQAFGFDVTSGNKRYRYFARVETGQPLVLDGVRVPAWKVRFDGERILSDSTREPAHRPLYVWFSKDGQRVPLRVDGRHAVGLFRVELANLDGVIQLAEVDR